MPATNARPNLRLRVRLFAAVAVLSNVAGNSLLTHGMHQAGDPGNSPLALIRALFDPWIVSGVALLVVWSLSQMTLLSWADLSYVMPVTAIGYVLSAFSGLLFLGEDISVTRWAGIALVTAGVMLVGHTDPASTRAVPK